jgi:hypothetical protein
MPRAKNKTEVTRPADIPFGGFIDVRLTPEQRAEFTDWCNADQLTFLDDVLGDEIKVGLSYDPDNETYQANLTSVKHAGSGMRVILTARAGTWEKAILLALYKHFVLLEGDWGRFRPSTGRASEV